MAHPSFNGLRVLALESRRAKEIAALIGTFGGLAITAPALREVPLESNTDAINFASALIRHDFDAVVFLTGVGTRHLLAVVEHANLREPFLAALTATKVIARGPKPLAVLRELQVPVWAIAPEPNTWHELIATLDARSAVLPLKHARIAVQEYGVSNPALLSALAARGATVTRVPVYQWQLPEDVGPLRAAVVALAAGRVDVILFTSGIQIVHLWQIAGEMQLEHDMRRQLTRTVIASIGPTTSEELTRHRLRADLEASHPKMGLLVREAAEKSADLLELKTAQPR
ncbi:MAG: uroporphyrinogen-III synthase [Acidobacteriota bacterium]